LEGGLVVTSTVATEDRVIRYWPFALGGLLGPVATGALALWMPSSVATATAFFVALTAASWWFQREAPSRRSPARRLGASLMGGLSGAVVAGLVAYLFQ
jgi:hypothetical protein